MGGPPNIYYIGLDPLKAPRSMLTTLTPFLEDRLVSKGSKMHWCYYSYVYFCYIAAALLLGLHILPIIIMIRIEITMVIVAMLIICRNKMAIANFSLGRAGSH